MVKTGKLYVIHLYLNHAEIFLNKPLYFFPVDSIGFGVLFFFFAHFLCFADDIFKMFPILKTFLFLKLIYFGSSPNPLLSSHPCQKISWKYYFLILRRFS